MSIFFSDHGGQTTLRRFALLPLALLASSLLAACSSQPTRDPEFAAVRPPVPQPAAAAPGAIYQAGHNLVLFEDLRARRVGDILTIKLVEKTDASKQAKTNTTKQNSTTISNPILLGSSVLYNAPGFLPLARTFDNTLETELRSDHDFEGDGESSQSNTVQGEISVTVAEVLPNGNLVIQGEKLFTLNQGHEHVRFSGIVRSVDISTENDVLSTKVADARIVYTGEGAVNDSNVLGWLSRFFLSAIFPF